MEKKNFSIKDLLLNFQSSLNSSIFSTEVQTLVRVLFTRRIVYSINQFLKGPIISED